MRLFLPRLAAHVPSHVSRNSKVDVLRARGPDDIVIPYAKRSAFTRAGKGAFRSVKSDELLHSILKESSVESCVPPELVGDIISGTCHVPSPAYELRAAALAAGFPITVPCGTVNRLCSSGMMAVRHIADSISAGDIDIGISVGYESMSQHRRPIPAIGTALKTNTQAADCVKPMGWTSEMLAEHFDVSRVSQDHYGLLSHRRAHLARSEGRFAEEIVPLVVPSDLPSDTKIVSQDDGIRIFPEGMSDMAKSKPAFPGVGQERSTGPNSSQVTDGAAVVYLMRRHKAEQLGLPVLARYVGVAIEGVEPRYMGIGPAAVIPRFTLLTGVSKLLERYGLDPSDIDLFEINEAFGSMIAYCVQQLNLDIEKVNVNGGAIALGHPLGASGIRQIVTGVHELRRRMTSHPTLLCTSMCVGSGMGVAGLFVV